MNLKEFDDYIKEVKWQEAKTYKDTVPHEYTIRGWRPDLEETFIDVVNFIRANGQYEQFYTRTHIYFYMGDYKYWTMGDPMETTWVLNRELVTNTVMSNSK